MSNKLLASSNAIWPKKKLTVAKLLEERSALKRKNILSSGLAVFLAAVSVLSIGSCRNNAKKLEQTRSENTSLKQSSVYFQKDASNLSEENQKLKPYKDFVNSIEPFYSDMANGRTKAEEKVTEQKNVVGQKKWDDACKTLGINPMELMRLKEME